MEKKNKAGRPTKINAIKKGQLKKGLVRFTFVTEKRLVDKMKIIAKKKKKTYKTVMTELLISLCGDIENESKTKNEDYELKMKTYLKKAN